jgi:hypothetical protein
MAPISTAVTAAAPLILAAIRDWQGNYTGAFAVVTGAWVVCAVLVFVSRPVTGAGATTTKAPMPTTPAG